MSVNTCIDQLLYVENNRNEQVYNENTPCFGLARVGQDDQLIVSGTLNQLLNVDFGKPLHSFIIPGTMHLIEKECYDHFNVGNSNKK